MNRRTIILAVVFLQPLSELHADGGSVRLSEQRGTYRITVFTSPTPLRAGTVDISVFVQDAGTGEAVASTQITIRAARREHPEAVIEQPATTAAATNKLFKAAVFDLPEPGLWDVIVAIQGINRPFVVQFEMEADEALPPLWDLAPWIAWPIGAILLYGVHQWLVWRKESRSKGKKEASSPEGEPALVTLSPNQRNNI